MPDTPERGHDEVGRRPMAGPGADGPVEGSAPAGRGADGDAAGAEPGPGAPEPSADAGRVAAPGPHGTSRFEAATPPSGLPAQGDAAAHAAGGSATDASAAPSGQGATAPHQPPVYGPPPAYGPGPGQGPDAGYGPHGYGGAAYGPPPGYGPGAYPGPGAGYGPPGFDTAPRPGVIPLRPLGLGELFGGAVAYMRGNPGSTVLPAAVVAVVIQLAQLLLQVGVRRPTTFRSPAAAFRALSTLGVTTVPVGLLSLVLGAVLTALLVVVMRGAMIGHRTGLGEAWRAGRSRVLGLIGLNLAIGLIVGAVALVGIVGGIAIGVGIRGAAGVLVAVVLVLVALAVVVYLGVLFSLAPAAYVIERVGIGDALRRSARLARGSWWRIFGIIALGVVAVGVIAVVFFVILGAVAVLTSPASVTASPLALIVSAVVTAALYAVYLPFATGLTTLIYTDQRIRRERFDLQLATWAQGAPIG